MSTDQGAGLDKTAGGADAGAGAGADKGGAAAGADKGTILDTSAGAADKGAAAGGTAAGGDKDAGGAGDKGAAATDWRTRVAGDDKELLKTLGRYTDEAAFGKAHRSLQTKLSSGELKKVLPADASPEEKAAWRKENGFPEKPEDYLEKLELPQGLVLGEEDKPIVAEFAAAALEANVDPKQLSGLVAKYYAIQDAQRLARDEADATFKQSSEDDLRKDWQGADYRRNLTAINNMLSTWPDGLAAQVLAGRDAEGRKLGDNPAFIRQLAAVALELNPAASLVPNTGADPVKGVDDRIAEIRRMRANEPDKFEANKKALEAEELQLIDAQLKMKKRVA